MSEKILRGVAGVLRHYAFHGKTLLWKSVTDVFPLKEKCVAVFPEGYRMKLDPQDCTQVMMLASAYERRTAWFIKHLLRPGDCFIDGGAYVGYYACMAAACAAPGAVYAFEPNPSLNVLLKEQVQLNPALSIKVLEAALSDDDRPKPFYSPRMVPAFDGQPHSSLHKGHTYTPEWRELTVKCVTLDGFIGEQGIKKAVLCKLDLERGEAAALRGARRSLETGVLESLIVEVTDETRDEIARELDPYAFEAVQDLRFSRPLANLKDLKPVGALYGTNVLFARGECAKRLQNLKFIQGVI